MRVAVGHIILLFLLLVRAEGVLAQVGGYPHTIQRKLPDIECPGETHRYHVKDSLRGAHFEWTITHQAKTIPVAHECVSANCDTIEIYWSPTLPTGPYTFTVKPILALYEDCLSDYTIDIDSTVHVRFNLDTIEIKPEFGICDGREAIIDLSLLKAEMATDSIFIVLDTGALHVGGDPPVWTTTQYGTYPVVFVDSNRCVYSGSFRVMEGIPPDVRLMGDTLLLPGERGTITARVSPPLPDGKDWTGKDPPYVWDGDQPTAQWRGFANAPFPTWDSVVYPTFEDGPQFIWLEVTDQYGCKGSDTVQIRTSVADQYRVPRAFTPNGDGIHDTWQIPGKLPDSELETLARARNVRVFDRWGNLVFYCQGEYQPWDGRDLHGRMLPMDSYHFELELEVPGEVLQLQGTVTIIR